MPGGRPGATGLDRAHHRPQPRCVLPTRATGYGHDPGQALHPLTDRPRPPLTPATIPALLDRHGLAPSRALGQNFLADPNTARRIARLAGVAPGDRVIEIGPGIGSLTVALLEAGAAVTAIELDRHLIPVLAETVGDAVQVVVADALTVSWSDVIGEQPEAGWKVIANLPYNVATPLVMRVLDEVPAVSEMLVMVQREVGERFAAGPGTKTYGAVSVKIGYHARAAVVGLVPPTVFIPRPKVDSALVRLDRHPAPPVDVPSPERMFMLVRAGFGQRRKMLRSALRAELGEDVESVLTTAGISPQARAETLVLDQWAALARVVG